jgi:hypothetical protein
MYSATAGRNGDAMADELSFDSFHQEWLEEVRSGNPSMAALGNGSSRKIFRQWLDVGDDANDPDGRLAAGQGGFP